MTFYPQTRIIRKGESRLYERLNNILIVNAAMVIASTYLFKGEAKFPPGTPFLHACMQLELDVKLPVSGPFEAAMADVKPDEIQIEISLRSGTNRLNLNEWAAGIGRSVPATFGLASAVANMIMPIFVEFYEAYRQFIHNKYRKTENYPSFWRFARVIRNAMAHGGSISIESTKESPATWYGLSYAHHNNGRRIVGVPGSDLTGGDLIVLMFEMDDLLNNESCPI